MGGEFIDRIMEYAGQRSKYADVRYMETEGRGAVIRNGEFDESAYANDSGYAIRILNDSIAMAYTDSEDWERIKNIIDNAVSRSRKPGKNKIYHGKVEKASWSEIGNDRVRDHSLEDMIKILKEADSVAADGSSIRISALSDRYVHQIYENTDGSHIEGTYSRIFFNYLIGVSENDRYEQSSEEFGWTGGYETFDFPYISESMRNDVSNLREIILAPSVEPGNFDVIIGPEISGIVAHESAGHPTEYDRIAGREAALAGESFLTGKKFPYRIGSDKVSVIDDPTIKGSYGYYQYDDEGVHARKRYLYRNGFTSEFLLNRESASWIGTESNGSGRSSAWDMEPLARMSTTYIEPGDYSFEELFEDVHRGIYIKSFTEWNIDDIRFNERYVGKEAYYIENGDIRGRVRRPVIETNTIKFYSAVDAVGKDLHFSAGICGKGDPEQGVEVWMGGPHMRLRNMRIK
ncbi:TldD/PmbA family protein [Thermoplasma sp.]|uniref:TldD/PmbA family protein n=1 Tax=Thermoplasma sp. TaxID=1973142 RepID=UPI002628387B|nr:TldD/PmbA family protein [Thermoplasma sp.]